MRLNKQRIRDKVVDRLDKMFADKYATMISERYKPPAIRPGEQKLASYRVCVRCVMDTSDPEITFDEDGVCNHCHQYASQIALYVKRDAAGWREMEDLAATIKAEGQGKPYDCIIGLSGGVDSTYVAYLVVRKLGLRPLAVHMDNGWNTEIAVRNIENVVTRLGIDLQTVVLEWEEFKDLQASFIRAGVPDCEIPTDHAIAAVLYKTAIEQGVRYIIGGSNLATEQMVPRTWSSGHGDWRYIRTVHDGYGRRDIGTYPHYTFWEHAIYWPYIKEMRMVYILNHIEYNKFESIELMKKDLGWVSYGDKHHESLYTRFYQTQYLIEKFGADKRRPHLSCLINDGRMSRDEALAELQRPPIDPDLAVIDREFVLKKLGLSIEDYNRIVAAPPKTYWDYDSDEKFFPDSAYRWALQNLDLLRRPVKTGWARLRADLEGRSAVVERWWKQTWAQWAQIWSEFFFWIRTRSSSVWLWTKILARLPFRLAMRVARKLGLIGGSRS